MIIAVRPSTVGRETSSGLTVFAKQPADGLNHFLCIGSFGNNADTIPISNSQGEHGKNVSGLAGFTAQAYYNIAIRVMYQSNEQCRF